MKRLFVLLCCVAIAFLGSVQLHSSVLSTELSQSTSIVVTDKDSPYKNQVIDELLDLQRSLIIPLQYPIPEKNAQSGFILIRMTPQYVDSLLQEKNGLIVGAYQDQTLVGYILLIDISEFKELYEDETIGYIDSHFDLETLDMLFARPKVGYIEQIAVKPGFSRSGIGSVLMDASKKLKPDGLVADVFLEPLKNKASLGFFSRVGFKKAGILHQYPRANFPHAHQTQVFFWNLGLVM